MSETPINTKLRKPTPKKEFSLADYKKKTGLEDVKDKILEWFKISKAMQDSTGLPGFPKGYGSLARGFTNTGKSTALAEAIVYAQQNGVLPIIIDTENNMGRKRLERMGFDWDCDFFITVDNDYILEKFGKPKDKDRKQASIEDLADCLFDFVDQQERGELPFDLLFAIDSIGTLDCIKSINAQEKGSSDNNMWNANAYERSFKYFLNNTIPNSRKVNKQYTNTLIAVQKVWFDAQQGAGVIKHKGGETFFFGCRLIYHFGGIQSHGTKKVIATSKKRDVSYGILTKVSVAKNQIDDILGGISLEGTIVSTPTGFITEDGIEQYKKDNILMFRDILGGDITAEDIGTNYVDIKTDEENPLDIIEKKVGNL